MPAGNGHVSDQCGWHSFWGILNVFLPEVINIVLIHLRQPPICNKYSMEQMEKEVKQTGNVGKAHALS